MNVPAGESEQPRSRTIERWIAFAMFLMGVAIIVCVIMGDHMRLAWAPRSWYVNRSLWLLIGVAIAGLGVTLMRRNRSALSESPFSNVVLYTRKDCHLCDDARDVLNRFAEQLPPVQSVDIDEHSELVEQFGTCVPVVEIDGRVRFRGKVAPELLERLIVGESLRTKELPS